jgi:hypothetical protein
MANVLSKGQRAADNCLVQVGSSRVSCILNDLRNRQRRIRLNEAAITAHWEGKISAVEFGRFSRQPQELP